LSSNSTTHKITVFPLYPLFNLLPHDGDCEDCRQYLHLPVHFATMRSTRSVANRYRLLLIVPILSSGVFIPLLPVFADQNSPAPNILIENQATASFIDSADGSTQAILSNKVQVIVAEVAGISVTGAGITNTVYRSNVVYFDFLVKNEGNDSSQIFLPPTPSNATIGGVALPASNIGQLQVIEYNDLTKTTAIVKDNLVDVTNGSVTGNLVGIPNAGSLPAGGYVKVRVPITVPFNANIGDQISVTLGNTAGQPSATNTPYLPGANGTGANDLYTQDNANGTTGEINGAPVNGDASSHRQEASAVQTIAVVAPPNIKISGTVWDDANNSANNTFDNIQNGTELGANITPAINAILVDSAGKVVQTTPVNSTGTYTFDNIPGAQNGLYVILSTTTGVIGTAAPVPSLPVNWSNTSPLTYAAVPFNIGITNITGKDFGLDQLPETIAINTAAQANPPGVTQYQVPTLSGTDPEDGALSSGKTFKIVTVPAATEGILYYDGVLVVAGDTISNYDPTKLTFDPVDGFVNMSFTYAAIDAASKVDLSPATATMAFNATPVSISGTIFHDQDSSAKNTFNNIQTNAEVGTNGVFGTSTVPLKAILVDITTDLVIGSQLVATDGTYSFTNTPPNIDAKVIISTTAGSIGSKPPVAAVPTGWVGTSPQDSGTFNTGIYPVTNRDFGIRQKAKFVLYKLITKINGQTTNPNDGKDLTISNTDIFNNVGNWPNGYLVGRTEAGKVQPGDAIEYTVYFMNNQGSKAFDVKVCDPIRGAQDYVPNSIRLQMGDAFTETSLTDLADGADRANYYAAGNTPTDCNAGAATSGGADKGGIVIGITGDTTTNQPALNGLPGATGVATPTASYGLFRFTTKVPK
jgi:hypothetical protein